MSNSSRTFLITGAAGFIGAALSIRLLKKGEKVIGIDNLNNYYDPNLKKSRLGEIEKHISKSSGEWTNDIEKFSPAISNASFALGV